MQENKKVNQRIAATKRALQDALIEMLKTQNINSISIRELCQAAKVNRTTFYNHYGSQFDVLNEIAETHLQNGYHVVVKEIESGGDFTACLIQTLWYIKNHKEYVKLLINQNNYDLVSHIRLSFPEFNQAVYRLLPDDLNAEEKKAVSIFVQYGAVRLLEEWIYHDCPRSPEDEVQLLASVVSKMAIHI